MNHEQAPDCDAVEFALAIAAFLSQVEETKHMGPKVNGDDDSTKLIGSIYYRETSDQVIFCQHAPANVKLEPHEAATRIFIYGGTSPTWRPLPMIFELRGDGSIVHQTMGLTYSPSLFRPVTNAEQLRNVNSTLREAIDLTRQEIAAHQ